MIVIAKTIAHLVLIFFNCFPLSSEEAGISLILIYIYIHGSSIYMDNINQI